MGLPLNLICKLRVKVFKEQKKAQDCFPRKRNQDKNRSFKGQEKKLQKELKF